MAMHGYTINIMELTRLAFHFKHSFRKLFLEKCLLKNFQESTCGSVLFHEIADQSQQLYYKRTLPQVVSMIFWKSVQNSSSV